MLALFRLGFPSASGLPSLNLAPHRNSQAHSTKGTRSPTRGQAPTACKSMVSGSISLPSPGFFSPFPHGTSALSVAVSYLALEGGPPGFKQGSSCPALLRYPHGAVSISPTGLSPSLAGLPSAVRLWIRFVTPPLRALQPRMQNMRFRLLPLRSPLLRQSLLMSFPPGTEMVQFPGSRSVHLFYSAHGDRAFPQPGYPIR